MRIATSGVYVIRNKVNGKVYVGSSVNINARWNSHLSELNKGDHHSQYLQRSWIKYGCNNFEFEVIELVLPIAAALLSREKYWIKKLKAATYKYGYNSSTEPGLPISRRKRLGSETSRAKLVESDIKAIVQRVLSGESPIDIAKSYGINRGHVTAICRGKTWPHVKRPIINRPSIGSSMWNARLQEADIPLIKSMLLEGKTHCAIAKAFGVTTETIGQIARGVTWKHVCPEVIIPSRQGQGSKLTAKDALQIKDLILDGYSDSEIAKRFNVGGEHIRTIRRGERWGSTTGLCEPKIRKPLSRQEYESVLKLLEKGMKVRRIAQKTGIAYGRVWRIAHGIKVNIED